MNLTDERDLYEIAADGKTVFRTKNVSGSGILGSVVEVLTINAHNLQAAQFSETTAIGQDAIIDSLFLSFSPAIASIQITLEESVDGPQIFDYIFNEAHNFFVAQNIDLALNSTKHLTLSISQAASSCTVNGFLQARI